ncbi:MAG: amidohydrolase family protein [Bacteroidota bacterium]
MKIKRLPQLFPLFILSFFSFTAANNKLIVIRNVNVIPMDKDTVLMNYDITIRNEVIVKLEPSGGHQQAAGQHTIDGTGKYVIPGLTDMHAHFFYEQGNNINTCEAELKLMLANGLTTARIQCGDSVYLAAKERVKKGTWAGPQLFVSSPQLVGKWPWKGKMFAGIVTTPHEAEQLVKQYKLAGYDEIKITFMVKAEVFDAIIKAARKEGIKVTGHVGPLAGLSRALAAKQQIEHMDEFIEALLPDTSYNHGVSVSDMGIWKKASWETVDHLDEGRIPLLVHRVKEAGIYVTPTNFFFVSCFGYGESEDEIKTKPGYSYIPSDLQKERWEIREHYLKDRPTGERRNKYVYLRRKMVYELWKAGVKLMAGSDSPEWFLVQGFAIHDELAELVRCGLTPYAALETATRNPAQYSGSIKQWGTVEEGKKASLVLLNANPLSDINNTRDIFAVVNKGKVYDQTSLLRLLDEARTALRR